MTDLDILYTIVRKTEFIIPLCGVNAEYFEFIIGKDLTFVLQRDKITPEQIHMIDYLLSCTDVIQHFDKTKNNKLFDIKRGENE